MTVPVPLYPASHRSLPPIRSMRGTYSSDDVDATVVVCTCSIGVISFDHILVMNSSFARSTMAEPSIFTWSIPIDSKVSIISAVWSANKTAFFALNSPASSSYPTRTSRYWSIEVWFSNESSILSTGSATYGFIPTAGGNTESPLTMRMHTNRYVATLWVRCAIVRFRPDILSLLNCTLNKTPSNSYIVVYHVSH